MVVSGRAMELADSGPALEHEPRPAPSVVVREELQVEVESGVPGHVRELVVVEPGCRAPMTPALTVTVPPALAASTRRARPKR